jgi:protoheme IX farnesyltransferase
MLYANALLTARKEGKVMQDYLALTKPRITTLIVACTAIGYLFGATPGARPLTLLHTLLGTALMASGTAALNQWYEFASDGKMNRTRQRPIPAGRMERADALIFGILLAAGGFAFLWFGANALASGIGLFTLFSYLFCYTPLKKISAACTTVGAIPGAMPPLIGYAAATGRLDASALALFLILFVWQFPHFYAIAWMYREDYARGGIRMLPVVQPSGQSTVRRVMGFSLLLIPVSVVPWFLGMAGSFYFIAASCAGIAMLGFAFDLAYQRTVSSARHMLLASVVYLPVLFATMLLDSQVI